MRTLKLLFILITVTLSLPKGAEAQYVQPMRYPHYSMTQQANIGVGTVRTTAASAYLEVGPTSGANKGFLPPRLSTTERDAIASPANGLMIYNKTTNDFQGWNGSVWVNFYIDTAASFITSFYRKPGTDSVFYTKGGVHTFGFKDTTVGDFFHLTNLTFPSGVRRHTLRTGGVGTSLFLDSALQINFQTYRNADSSIAYMRLPSTASSRVKIGYTYSTNIFSDFYIFPDVNSVNIGFNASNSSEGTAADVYVQSGGTAVVTTSKSTTINVPDSGNVAYGVFINTIPMNDTDLTNKKQVVWDSVTKKIWAVNSIVNPTDYVPDSRILTINGVAYDLSADRTWTISPGAADSTFYTANGTITYARRVNANGYPITFDSTGLFRIRDTSVSSTGALYGHIYDFNDGVDFLDYDSILTVGYTQNSLTGIHLYVKDKNDLDTSIYLKLNPDNILLQGITKTNSRLEKAQGADVASAAGAITLGADGNSFEITGTNSITAISNINWQNGAEIILLFTSTATLVDGTANSGTDIGFELAGNANFTASAGAVWKGILSEIGGTQRWREVSRTVN